MTVSFDPDHLERDRRRRRRRPPPRMPWWRRVAWIRIAAIAFCLVVWGLVARACLGL